MTLVTGPEEFEAEIQERYQLGAILGSGGWGTVYSATPVSGGHDVALKVLSPDLVDPASVRRFLQEVEIARAVSHPGIARLLDAGIAGGRPWYAMPRYDGPTLEERIRRDVQLPVLHAMTITADLATALAHAHRQSIVHRDVKPANVVLTPARAVLLDFGVARAMSQASSTPLRTTTGLLIGTVQYMSPEQATGARDLDGRADLYSLGVVLYEMLAGARPFNARTEQALVRQHLQDPVPPLRSQRPGVPPALEAVVLRLLAKSPADRYQTGEELLDALAAARDAVLRGDGGRAGPRAGTRWRRAGLVVVLPAAAVIGALAWTRREAATARLASADTTRVLLAPLHDPQDAAAGASATEAVRAALGQWEGVHVVDAPRGLGGPPYDDGQLREAALDLRARRVLVVRLRRAEGRPRLVLVLRHLATPDSILARGDLPFDERAAGAADSLREAVAALLVRTPLPAWAASFARVSRALPVQQDVAHGLLAFDAWELERADSTLARALRADPASAPTALLLALARMWNGRPPPEWSVPARSAHAGLAQLARRERRVAMALVARLEDNVPAACAQWDSLAREDSLAFLGHFGAAHCLARDRTVLRDARSPSGWRFRASYRRALFHYQRAFELHPAALLALRPDGFLELRRILTVEFNALREGTADRPAGARFVASPSLRDDTLAFIPFPVAEFQADTGRALRAVQATRDTAIRLQRSLFRTIAETWRAADPGSAAALEALAWARATERDRGALELLQEAGRVAGTATERLYVRGVWAWMAAVLGYPGDTALLAQAARVADSVSGTPAMAGQEPGFAATLGALAGRATRATDLARLAASATRRRLPAALAPAVAALEVQAALGVDTARLRAGDHEVDSLLATLGAVGDRERWRMQALLRTLLMAPLDVPLKAEGSVPPSGDAMLAVRLALRRQDLAAARAALEPLARRWRAEVATGAPRTLEITVGEAEALLAIGDTALAAASLARAIVSPPVIAPDPIRAASLGRALVLQARIARALGVSATAAAARASARALWGASDPVVRARFGDILAP